MRTSLALAAAALLLAHSPAHAQESRQPLYKVQFDIHEGTGPAAKVRRYSLVATANSKSTFNVGSRVPVATGSSGSGASTQFTYLDIGVHIECIVGDAKGGGLGMHGKIDISSIMQHESKTESSNPPNPTVGQTKVEFDTAVDLGKPMVVATIDDPETLRHTQVEVIVTRQN